MFREIVGFGLCLKCYSQKRRNDPCDGILPFALSPNDSQRRDRLDLAIQRANLSKILTILESKPTFQGGTVSKFDSIRDLQTETQERGSPRFERTIGWCRGSLVVGRKAIEY